MHEVPKERSSIMKPRTFDILMPWTAALLVVALIGGGSLMLWGYNIANNYVVTRLAQHKIYFPPATAFKSAKVGTEITPSMIPSVSQYAGQQMLTGAQAEVNADQFIAAHLE